MSPDKHGSTPYESGSAPPQVQSESLMCRVAWIAFMRITVEVDEATATVERRIINGRITGMKRYEGQKVTIIVHPPDPL